MELEALACARGPLIFPGSCGGGPGQPAASLPMLLLGSYRIHLPVAEKQKIIMNKSNSVKLEGRKPLNMLYSLETSSKVIMTYM